MRQSTNDRFTPRHRSVRGFTIIEVMIVLAIAGLILIVVMIAVPALQRNERNVARKQLVNTIGAELHQYYADNHNYPQTVAEGNTFIHNYLSDVPRYYTINFYDISHPHDYSPPLDTVAVQYGHWCNRYGDGENATDPIAGTDVNTNAFVIWTAQEPTTTLAVFCVDNH